MSKEEAEALTLHHHDFQSLTISLVLRSNILSAHSRSVNLRLYCIYVQHTLSLRSN